MHVLSTKWCIEKEFPCEIIDKNKMQNGKKYTSKTINNKNKNYNYKQLNKINDNDIIDLVRIRISMCSLGNVCFWSQTKNIQKKRTYNKQTNTMMHSLKANRTINSILYE